MRWIPLLSLPAMVLCAVDDGDAGQFKRLHGHRKAQCCHSVPDSCCRPTIVRPCIEAVHSYQRRCVSQKPIGCHDTQVSIGCCSPSRGRGSGNKLIWLIKQAQTACYPKQRRRAVHRLSDRYECICHPEVMAALVHSLNDSDPRVRQKAADEIGDQLIKTSCCGTHHLVSALTGALADCDRGTRRNAERALRVCGYDVVDGDRSACCLSEGGQLSSHDLVARSAISQASYQELTSGASVQRPVAAVMTFQTKREFLESQARPNKGRSSLAGLFGLAK